MGQYPLPSIFFWLLISNKCVDIHSHSVSFDNWILVQSSYSFDQSGNALRNSIQHLSNIPISALSTILLCLLLPQSLPVLSFAAEISSWLAHMSSVHDWHVPWFVWILHRMNDGNKIDRDWHTQKNLFWVVFSSSHPLNPSTIKNSMNLNFSIISNSLSNKNTHEKKRIKRKNAKTHGFRMEFDRFRWMNSCFFPRVFVCYDD